MLLNGTCKKWFGERGFGFLQVEGQADVFVHARQVERAGIMTGLTVGERFEFELGESRDGKTEATNIRKIDGGSDNRPPRYGE
jgi:CspA family cold shock protein